jgi:Tfp pilus assembly protein PilN
VPRINLLPVQKSKTHSSLNKEVALFSFLVIATGVGITMWGNSVEEQIQDVDGRIFALSDEINEIKASAAKIEEFKAQSQTLEKKLLVIQQLGEETTGPARMLNTLVNIFNSDEKIWLTRLIESTGKITMSGGAMTHENISDFHITLKRYPHLFDNIKLARVTTSSKAGVNYFSWEINCKAKYMVPN